MPLKTCTRINLRYVFVMEDGEFLFLQHTFPTEPFFLSSLGNLLLAFRARASRFDKLFWAKFFLHAKRSYSTLHLQKRRVVVTTDQRLLRCIVGHHLGVGVCHLQLSTCLINGTHFYCICSQRKKLKRQTTTIIYIFFYG